MSQDPTKQQDTSSRVQETLDRISNMENNLQSLININKTNTLELMLKLDDSTLSEMPTIVESELNNPSKLISKPIHVWTPPNAKQCAMAATNPIPYTKNGFTVPSKTSVIGIISNSKHWDKFFTPKIAPNPGDWLHDQVKDRKGQSFLEFCNRKLQYPSHKLDTVGLITIGNFNIKLDIMNDNKMDENENKEQQMNNDQNNLFEMLSSIVEVYFGMKVEIIESIKSDDITSRYNDSSGTMQLLTTDIHDTLFKIKAKKDKLFCLMGVSIMDLYPKESWNFVFGQARMKAGTGVFSFARYIPAFSEIRMLKYDTGYGLQSVDVNQIKLLKALVDGQSTDDNILRTLKFDRKTQILFFRRCIIVLVHEIGHLFGMKHCVYMECIMNGSNHQDESDMKPVYLCAVCLHKLYFCRLKKTRKNKSEYKPLDVLERYRKLAMLFRKYGLVDDAKWYQRRVEFISEQI